MAMNDKLNRLIDTEVGEDRGQMLPGGIEAGWEVTPETMAGFRAAAPDVQQAGGFGRPLSLARGNVPAISLTRTGPAGHGAETAETAETGASVAFRVT